MFNQILNRMPMRDQIVPVYAVIAFLSFVWAIIALVWKIPAWLYFQTVYEILPILAYFFRQIFFDTLIYLGILLAVCMILPARFLKDEFIVRGTWAAIGVLGSYIAYVNLLFMWGDSVVGWTIAALLLGVTLAVFSAHVRWLAKIATEVSDRLVIFLYILIPVSLVSILTVIIRNIN